jgi:hypothetical protein
MSYIIKSTSPFVSIKLTEKGREQLSQGLLNFSSFAIGDSEINYNREALVDETHGPNDLTLSATTMIMRPFDRQPNIKTFITPDGAPSPFQPLPGTDGSINVIKAVVNNAAEERGFFTVSGGVYTTIANDTFTPFTQGVPSDHFTGGTAVQLVGNLAVSLSAVSINDFVLIKYSNPTAGDIVLNENLRALPNLWYKVQNIYTDGGTGNSVIVVDRNLPNLSAATSAFTQTIFYKGGEIQDTFGAPTTTAYWDSGTLSFDGSSNVTCHDVPVWNMNNVWCEDLAGVTGLTTTNLYENYTKFGSYTYLGTKNPYLEYFCLSTATTLTFDCNGPGFSYPDDVSKSISIIHYTNNTISNLYGEFLYIDTTNDKIVKLHLPDLMYHRRGFSTGSGTTQGMSFLSSGDTKYIGTSNIEYVDLIEDPSMISSASTALVVGRVFPQLKMVVISNDEIVSAVSYKSNRSWTLPALAANITSPTGGTSTGVLDIGSTMYLTYVLENTNTSGYTSSMPCQDYIKVTNSSSGPKDVAFRIGDTDMLPYMRKVEDAGYDGLGFYANKFTLLYQVVADSTSRPDPGAWKAYDFTTTGLTTTTGATIDPKALENQTPSASGFIIDLIKDGSATTFDLISLLNLPANNASSYLQFGDERFFYGNIETYIGATIFKTMFDITINSSKYNATSNPTRSKDLTTNPPNIKVSEVGIYDTANNLVCIGKLSAPVALELGNTIMLELSMDF